MCSATNPNEARLFDPVHWHLPHAMKCFLHQTNSFVTKTQSAAWKVLKQEIYPPGKESNESCWQKKNIKTMPVVCFMWKNCSSLRKLFGFPLKDQRLWDDLFDWNPLSPWQQDHRQEACPSFTGPCHQQCNHSAVSDSPISHSACGSMIVCICV